MKTNKILMVIFLVSIISIFGVIVQGQDSSEDAYEKAISAVENWIQSTPATDYQKAEGNQKFMWRVGLEENPRGNARFTYYEKLLDEIGDSEFTYESYIFNNKTIRCFQFKHYGDYYSEAASQEVLEPAQFFQRQYEFYKKNITSKKEQWVWLSGFFKFFNSSLYGTEEERFVSSLIENNYSQIIDVLNQYLITSKYMLENNPEAIKRGEVIYSESRGYVSFGTESDNVFRPLVSFVKRFKQRLKEDAKQTILNFIIPEYQDTDQAVKIYKELK